MLRWIVWRDLMLAWRRRADALSTLFFFVIVVSLFPLGIGPGKRITQVDRSWSRLGCRPPGVNAFPWQAVCK